MQLRIELRELAGALGEVRNIDVLVPRLTDPAVARPLADARVRAFGEVRERLEEPAARGLMLRLAEWLAIGEWLNAPETAVTREQPIDAFAADLLQRTRRRLKRRGRRLASVDDEARHEARIVAKKLRYAAEFFAETFPAPKARRRRAAFLEALEALQEALGDLNDQAAGRAVLAEIGISEDVARASLGRAIDRDVLLARAEASYDRLMAIKRFWI